MKTSILFEGKHYDDFVEIVGSLIPSVRQNIQQKNFYVPALDCWQIAKYDRWIFQFAASLSESIESGSESVLHEQMSAKDFVFPPAVAPKTISSLFPHIAAGFTSSVIQTRLSTLLVNKLGNARFHIKDLDLVFVPAPLLELRGNDPRIQGPGETIEWLPLRDADWPPVLRRTVRRWKSMSTDQPNVMAPKSRLKWLTSPFNR